MKNSTKILLLLFLLLGAQFKSLAHVTCEDPISLNQTFYKIEFGTDLNIVASNATKLLPSWRIAKSELVLKQGTGNETGEFQFDEPGLYTVEFTLPGDSDHGPHSVMAQVEVVPTRIEYLIDQASLSQDMEPGKTMQGTQLLIPIKVSTFANEKLKYGPVKVISTGYAELEARFENTLELSPGNHVLNFELNGVAPEKGHVQFAFFNTVESGSFFNLLIK